MPSPPRIHRSIIRAKRGSIAGACPYTRRVREDGPNLDDSTELYTASKSPAQASGAHGAVLVVVLHGVVQEFVVPSFGTPLVVGRSPACGIHIDDPSVSRQHARIIPVEDGYLVQDLKSKNGTWVNGVSIADKTTLITTGDAIRFGHVVAQLTTPRVSRTSLPRLVLPAEFDERLADESERCVRYDRNLVLVAIETHSSEAKTVDDACAALNEQLRMMDVVTVRGPGRIDVLLAECASEDGKDIAARIHGALSTLQIHAGVGIASYPGDVGSVETLHIAARTAMRAARHDGVESAGHGVRTVQLGDREIIVAEPSMMRLFALVERVASAAAPVLVTGETGSGKEIIAEALHALGVRAPKRLVKLNCAALPEQLLESELFGHERGAFTGADSTKPGIFEEADGGTLFLDEIGEMPPSLQAKLLRVLEDKRVRRLGSTRERAIDARFVAATHRDLKALTAAGKFREDLYYRIGAIVLRVPPLREPPRDIVLLAQRFAASAASDGGHEFEGFSAEALRAFETYAWPGNIREMRNVIASAILLTGAKRLELDDLPPELRPALSADAQQRTRRPPARTPTTPIAIVDAAPPALEDELRQVERERIIEALERCGGNQTRAAEYLSMPRRTLVRKIGLHGIGQRGKRRATDDTDS